MERQVFKAMQYRLLLIRTIETPGEGYLSFFEGGIRILLDDGREKAEVLLDSPDKGLLLDSGLWREMLWEQSDSVLCVAASEHYDEADYIREYDRFLAWCKEAHKE